MVAAKADKVLEQEMKLLDLPGDGLPTVELLDARRNDTKTVE